MSIGNLVKSLQTIMRKDPGIDGDAQRIAQMVWILFLKIFDAKEEEWEFYDDKYTPIVLEKYQWRNWAADSEGITGDELLEFIDELFVELKNVIVDESTDRRKILVKEFFLDTNNYMKSGTLLREVINKINEVDFSDYKERHAFNDVYETILKDLQSAGNAGEFYTCRPVTDFVIDILDPKLGEKVADFACGTGGFLISALNHIKYKQGKEFVPEDLEILGNSIHGVEKKPMPHSLCLTNMLLHDLDTPNIVHGNGLGVNVRDFKSDDLVDVIAMNPPFGGMEEKGIQTNFPLEFRTSETADLFFVRMMYQLKEDGRAGVVLPDGFLFGEGIKTRIKEKLFEEFDLHTIVRLPKGVFAPYTNINTNILFFTKGKPTKEVWFFEHPLPTGYKIYSKTKPMRHSEFDLEKEWWSNREESEFAWKVSVEDIKNHNYNIDIKNPNKQEEIFVDPQEALAKYNEIVKEINEIKEVLRRELKSALRGV